MSSLIEQIEYLKNRYLQNKYDSNNLNDVITLINDIQNETHASDSTTRKGVGTFSCQGVHIENEEYLPFPTIPTLLERSHWNPYLMGH